MFFFTITQYQSSDASDACLLEFDFGIYACLYKTYVHSCIIEILCFIASQYQYLSHDSSEAHGRIVIILSFDIFVILCN